MAKKSLSAALTYIESKYAKDAKDLIYDPTRVQEGMSSGSAIIDAVTGINVGGFLIKRKLVEIAAPESTGKTTLCLQACAQAQKAGWVGVYLDVEQAFDYNYAKTLGVELDDETFTVIQPTYAEQAEKMLNIIIDRADIDYIVIDSIAAMKPESQVFADDSTGKGQVKGGHAMFWSSFSPKLQALATEHNIAVLLTNQVRRKLSMGGMFDPKAVTQQGIGTGFSSDDSWVTTGGEAIKFYLSCRYLLNFKKKYQVQYGDKKIWEGNIVEIACVKNKLAPPYAKARFLIRFVNGFGTDDYPMFYDIFKEEGLITAKANNHTLMETDYNPELKAKNRAELEDLMKTHSKEMAELYKFVWSERNNPDNSAAKQEADLDFEDDFEDED